MTIVFCILSINYIFLCFRHDDNYLKSVAEQLLNTSQVHISVSCGWSLQFMTIFSAKNSSALHDLEIIDYEAPPIGHRAKRVPGAPSAYVFDRRVYGILALKSSRIQSSER